MKHNVDARILSIEDYERATDAADAKSQAKDEKESTMESWRKVWRDGVEPLLSMEGLEALRKALANDDPRLLQGATTTPPPLMCVQEWPVEAACALGYCGWQGERLETVGQVEEFFARCCFEADQWLGEAAACRLQRWPRAPGLARRVEDRHPRGIDFLLPAGDHPQLALERDDLRVVARRAPIGGEKARLAGARIVLPQVAGQVAEPREAA